MSIGLGGCCKMPASSERVIGHTQGTLLNGRVHYTQPRSGFRSGIEPVLLAATIPARSGQVVIEGGCGAGAGLLCLHARVPGTTLYGIEQDPNLAVLAESNATANHAPAHVITADLLQATLPSADHAFANPPYHPAGGTLPADPFRRAAKHAELGSIAAWVRALAKPLRRLGTLTLIIATPAVPRAIDAMAQHDCPATALLPLWPRAGRSAKLVILRGVRGGHRPFCLLPGVVLHNDSSGFTSQIEAVLREGTNLPMCTPGRFPGRPESM